MKESRNNDLQQFSLLNRSSHKSPAAKMEIPLIKNVDIKKNRSRHFSAPETHTHSSQVFDDLKLQNDFMAMAD